MEAEYTFSGQKSGEKVVEVIPCHPYILYPAGFRTVLVLTLVVAIFLFFPKFWIVGLVLAVIILIYFINTFYSYKETIFIITDLRIFYIDQKGFFRRKITEVSLDNIIDISSDTSGFAKTMLKYGDIIIRTAGAREGGDIILSNISNPYNVQQRISSVIKNR